MILDDELRASLEGIEVVQGCNQPEDEVPSVLY
jgi:hypothetical protein